MGRFPTPPDPRKMLPSRADPEHRGDAERGEAREQLRHPGDEPAADGLHPARPPLREREPDVVHLHDEGDEGPRNNPVGCDLVPTC